MLSKKMSILHHWNANNKRMIKSIFDYFEKKAFGVCEWWGKKLGIRTYKIRLSFIYLSFITVGSYLLVYLIFISRDASMASETKIAPYTNWCLLS